MAVHESHIDNLEQCREKTSAAHEDQLEALRERLNEASSESLASAHAVGLQKSQIEHHETQATEYKLQLQAANESHAQVNSARGDHIEYLEQSRSKTCSAYEQQIEALQERLHRSRSESRTSALATGMLDEQLENHESQATKYQLQLQAANERHAQDHSAHEGRIEGLAQSHVETRAAHAEQLAALEERLNESTFEHHKSVRVAETLERQVKTVTSEHKAALAKGAASHPQLQTMVQIFQKASAGFNTELESVHSTHESRIEELESQLEETKSEGQEMGRSRTTVSGKFASSSEMDVRRTRSS